MNVKVNNSCIGCGACESICDSVFEVDDIAKVKKNNVEGHEECAQQAAEACPVSAIEIE